MRIPSTLTKLIPEANENGHVHIPEYCNVLCGDVTIVVLSYIISCSLTSQSEGKELFCELYCRPMDEKATDSTMFHYICY